MSDTALRQLLAEFVVEVDKAGELAKGNAAVDALKRRLEELQAAAKPAARAVGDAFAGIGAKAQKNLLALGAQDLMKGSRGGDGFAGLAGLTAGAQFAPTRQTLQAGRAAMADAEAAAARYAGTLRGKLGTALQAVRDGFNGRSGGGSGGKSLLDHLSDFKTQIKLLGAGAVVAGVRHLVDSIGDIGEAAQRLGVTTDQFQRLRVLAEQNGVGVESLGTAFRTLANAAVQPTKETTAAFAKLGVQVKDSKGQFKSTNDLFFEVSKALAGVTNETERSALAQDLLGRGAQELKPLFAGGTEAVEKQQQALAELNVISKETITQADDLSDSWKTIGPSLLSAAEPLINILLPALAKLTEWLFKGIDTLGKWLKQTDLTSVALTALGAVMVTKVLPSLELMIGLGGGATRSLFALAGAGAKAALSFLRLALPLLAIEDFITFLRGGDSETGRLLDALFGKGASEGTLKALQDLAAAFKDLWNWMLGNGQGEKVKALFTEIDEGIRVMLNDLLKAIGIGKGGLNGPLKEGGDALGIGSAAERLGDKWFGKPQTMAEPALPPVGFYGPPTAEGSVAGNKAVSFGDTNVTVVVGQYGPASPPDIGRAVVNASETERNRLVAAYGGFGGL